MTSLKLTALAALWLLLPTWLMAQDNSVVVELYTSQGCSSCPPADRLMHDLAKRDDVIPLALHVDYWDYIGWKDLYADPAHTRRQKQYAHAGGRQMVYTPQMIVGGVDDVVGARSMELAELIAKHRAQGSATTITARRDGDRLRISAGAAADLAAACDIHLVRYNPRRVAEITRGENAGKTLTYVNVVEDWQVLGRWDGSGPLALETDLQGDLPAVVLLQMPGPGRIMAAARVE